MQKGDQVRVIQGVDKGKTGTVAYMAFISLSQLEWVETQKPNPLDRVIVDLDDGDTYPFCEDDLEEID